MLSGRREMAAPKIAPTFAPVWRSIAALALAVGLAWWVSMGAHLPQR
jgi:hypothetical protein